MEEVVAFKIGTTITNSLLDAKTAVDLGRDIEPLTRRRMQLMSAFDLGKKWDILANSPTLFCIDDNGHILVDAKEQSNG